MKLPGEVGDIGFKQAMQQKWLAMDKSGGEPKIVRKVRPERCLHCSMPLPQTASDAAPPGTAHVQPSFLTPQCWWPGTHCKALCTSTL